jgi:signal transduction histidine kinase
LLTLRFGKKRSAQETQLTSNVLSNLLSNARKFTRPRAEARIEFVCERRAGREECFVRDNGVGFDPKF